MNNYLLLPPQPECVDYFQLVNTLIQKLNNRYLACTCYQDCCVVKYKTPGGFYTSATYNKSGDCLKKEYFRSYDEGSGQLYDYVCNKNCDNQF